MVKHYNNNTITNFKNSELSYIAEFNKINKNISENNYNSEIIIYEINYLISKIEKILPSNKSAMIRILEIMKNNIDVNN
jgi:hypothetical protein